MPAPPFILDFSYCLVINLIGWEFWLRFCYTPRMAEEKVIFIIPGFRHSPTTKAYSQIAKILKTEGYKPILIKIPWRKTTISENTEYFLRRYKRRMLVRGKIKKSKTYILGFSYGAMIAFIASTKVSVGGLILCSLSPYFKEDMSRQNIVSLQRRQDFLRLHCGTLAKKIKAKKILMLYGTKEEKQLKKRVKKVYEQIASNHKYLFPIPKVEHDIGDWRYLDKIHEAARELN